MEPVRPHCWIPPCLFPWADQSTMAASTSQKCLTSLRSLCILASYRVPEIFPVRVCRLVSQLLHQYPILPSTNTSGFRLCLWRQITPSHLLKSSRPSWLIHLHLWMLPSWLLPPLLPILLLQPQPTWKQRKNERSGTGTWDLVSN